MPFSTEAQNPARLLWGTHSSQTLRLGDFAIVLLTLLAPALGGSTQLWAQAVLTAGCAALVCLLPPKQGPPFVMTLVGAGLLLLSALAFLPESWFGSLRWRQLLIPAVGLDLSSTLSPQPWKSLERSLLLLAGLVWASFLVSRTWIARRRILLSIYAGGIALLAALALVCLVFDFLPPFWHPLAPFGFFPNRNQTGNVLALGGVVTLALTFHEFARNRDVRFVWAGAYVLIGVAVVINGSRSGVLLYLGGSFLWVVWTGWGRRELKYLSLGASVVFLALTLFVLFGGKTLDRFSRLPDQSDDRILIQRDALRLLKDASWHGIGLGNFPAVFSHYRHDYIYENRPIHPESDWLWVGIEMGYVAPLLILAGLLWWLIRHFPSADQDDFRLRAAVWMALAGFALHGLVDVSGHRMGSLWPALFLFALLPGDQTGIAQARWPVWAFRSAGTVLGLSACWWFASLLPIQIPPTSASQQRIKKQISAWQAIRGDRGVIRLCTEGLRYAPLDWELYFGRALAEVGSLDETTPALADFSRARQLELNSAEVPFVEGAAWLGRQPSFSLGPWFEALRRASATNKVDAVKEKAGLFERMLLAAEPYPEIRDEVRALALDDPDLLLVFMNHASREEFLIEQQRLLLEDPELKTLSQEQRATFFSLWAKFGDRDDLEKRLLARADWQAAGWFSLAAVRASREDYEAACELADRFAPKPALPSTVVEGTLPELRTKFLMLSNDFSTGYFLYLAEMRDRQTNDALLVLEGVTRQPASPAYFDYLEAELQMKKGAWQDAWQAWLRYWPH